MKAVLLAGLLALAAAPALAHAVLDATAPENGAVLAAAPPHVVLTFAKRVRLVRVRMTHGDGAAVDLDLAGQAAFAARFAVPLADLGSGLYRIEWRGLSIDGHVVRGAFAFRVR